MKIVCMPDNLIKISLKYKSNRPEEIVEILHGDNPYGKLSTFTEFLKKYLKTQIAINAKW
jgi:hypothetical protein